MHELIHVITHDPVLTFAWGFMLGETATLFILLYADAIFAAILRMFPFLAFMDVEED